MTVLTQRGLVLTPRGQNLFALCPFHQESTPSFCVNPREQLWQCFGCGEGGDVFTFLMKKDGLTFPEAVQALLPGDLQESDLEEIRRERPARELGPDERPGPEILEKVTEHWQAELARSIQAQAYLKSRKLWAPDLLRALKVGFSAGTLPRAIGWTDEQRGQMRAVGLFNKKGNEFFYGRIVVPLFNEAGVLVGVYGRAIGTGSEVPHLYLPGPRRGVFNRPAIQEGVPVILTESILDALSLLVLEFPNVTASFGTNGFTTDLLAALVKAHVPRVYCAYDADPAGDKAARQLAQDLAGHGIEVLRVVCSCKDPNEFLVGGGTREDVQALLETARPILVPENPFSLTGSVTPSVVADPGSTGPLTGLTVTVSGRTYHVVALPSRGLSLKARLRVTHEGKPFVDTVNFYSDAARTAVVARLSRIFGPGVSLTQIEADLYTLMDQIESQERQTLSWDSIWSMRV